MTLDAFDRFILAHPQVSIAIIVGGIVILLVMVAVMWAQTQWTDDHIERGRPWW